MLAVRMRWRPGLDCILIKDGIDSFCIQHLGLLIDSGTVSSDGHQEILSGNRLSQTDHFINMALLCSVNSMR